MWRITAFSRDDLDAVLSIEAESFENPWGHLSFSEELSNKNALNLVAKREDMKYANTIIAYFISHIIFRDLYILKLAVSKDWRRLGVASQLLEKSIRVAIQKDVKTAILDVRQTNRPAIELYRKHGFHPVGIRPNYYTDTREDALVMKKNLKEDL
jgi:ribosomal-protein-alanine N-acetyltransferase